LLLLAVQGPVLSVLAEELDGFGALEPVLVDQHAADDHARAPPARVAVHEELLVVAHAEVDDSDDHQQLVDGRVRHVLPVEIVELDVV
jgi:hypothetical protein